MKQEVWVRLPLDTLVVKLKWKWCVHERKRIRAPTLVLNRNWQPVNVATVAQALVLLWNDAARVVDVADYQTFTWDDWSKLRPRDGDDFVQTISVQFACRR